MRQCFHLNSAYTVIALIGLTVLAAPAVLTAAGFTGAGIAAGSVASSLMSATALANGGGIAAGSVVATLQAAGESHIREGGVL